MRRLADEQGSIMPLFAGLLGIVFLILAFVVDEAWVNYHFQLARQTADFAAEAAAGPEARTIWSTVTVQRVRYDSVTVTTDVCADPGPDASPEQCLAFETDTVYVPVWDSLTQAGPQSQFKGDWRSLFDCSPGQAWTCQTPTIVEEVRFDSNAGDIARQVFYNNWDDNSSATAQVTGVDTRDGSRIATVSLALQIRSLFGLFTTGAIPITGRAVVQYQPLVLK